ncbi:MAG: tetratricopeptide repeat protein [Candidatus Omnitrophica bacterium]|nr:tetratricopeptide repeat protein [Candidatus Omnitrophota bacterium]MBU2251479.1 tetratricopeptide repeat protein [Candidatus Omnitrophota bacterium]MBU2265664.1 tetratricopeptide repeat protein [Candidatus Omnitrophota bacterium]MBU2474036.1 tetratricopeptide repeat protein [Candidatus Omnitrophota bacterium]
MGKGLIVLTLFIIFTVLVFGEEIVLKNGKVINGKIVKQTPEFIKVEVSGVAIKYYRETIETIDGEKITFSSSEATSENNFKEERVFSQDWLNHYGQAEKYLETRQFDQAIVEFQEVLKIDPESFEAYTGIGFVYIEFAKYDQAIDSFNRAIEINPGYAEAYDNIGVVYSLQRQYQQAIPYFEKAIHANLDYVPAYNNLGSTYFFLNRYPEAVICYQQAFQIDPQNADSAYNLGLAFRDLGKPQEAKDYLKKAIELYKVGGNAYGVQKAEAEFRAIP